MAERRCYTPSAAPHKRYSLTGNPEVLERAIEPMREAVEQTTQDDPKHWATLSVYGVLLRDRSEVTGDLPLLHEAVRHGRDAVEHGPAGHPSLAYSRINLAAMLRTLFIKTRDVAVLREKVDLERCAVRDLGGDDAGRAAALSNLSASLRELYQYAGDHEALEEAVESARQSAGSMPGGHPVPPSHLMNLGLALLDRSTCPAPDPTTSRRRYGAAGWPSSSGPGHTDRAGCLALLGAALDTRYSRPRRPGRPGRGDRVPPRGAPADTAAQRGANPASRPRWRGGCWTLRVTATSSGSWTRRSS